MREAGFRGPWPPVLFVYVADAWHFGHKRVDNSGRKWSSAISLNYV